MPIDQKYREEAIEKVKKVGELLREKIEKAIKDMDEEDLEYGVSIEIIGNDLKSLWEEGVERNNYMEVVSTEIMEHHDGAYLKATFRNNTENGYADRYVSVWSSGKTDISYAFSLSFKNVVAKVQPIDQHSFRVFLKSE
ncbi:MAG: hypothetical protein ACK4SM_04595 [Aquificaceae bacterium]